MTLLDLGESVQDAWYEVVEGDSLRQGDIFQSLLAIWPSQAIEPPETPDSDESLKQVDVSRSNFIVTSASCDVDQKDYPYVLLSRLVTTEDAVTKQPNAKEKARALEVIRRGFAPSQFLLPSCKLGPVPLVASVVLHKTHTLLPIAYLKKSCTKPRLRLRHPFREKFGNWVGANFSRVGPEDAVGIPSLASIFAAQILETNLDDTV